MSNRLHGRWIILSMAALGAAIVACLLVWPWLFSDLPDPRQPLARAGTPSILITDRHGRTLYEVIDPEGSKYLPLTLDAIPEACQQATIATEDGHFYSHPGVDPIAIVRAAWLNWRSGRTVSGGSTLTQQLARNLYMDREERTERSLRRKLREAWLAWQLERRYGKREVLALYLNTTYYGHFATGIEAAAQAYFGMHASELDLAQCALLAGLPQYPPGYNPMENPEAAQSRQRVVLDLMVKDRYISAQQAEEASKERLAFASTPFPIEAPHFVMWVQGRLEQLLSPEQLRALNLPTGEGPAARGGLRVETTLDLDWQQAAEAIVARRLAQLRPCATNNTAECDPNASPERRVDDAALVALDPTTGAVRAMVGSADYFDASINGAVNAALSYRQPGSAIKPLTYAVAFDPEQARQAGRQPWTPATLIADIRTVFPTDEGRPYVPNNYDMQYHGPVTARTALASSYNIPAVKALQYVGLRALVDQASRLGINGWVSALGQAGTAAAGDTSLTQGTSPRFGLSLTLGGGEVRLLDLTAAYAAFANGGRRVTPYAISRVTTMDGEPVLDCVASPSDCGMSSPRSPGPQVLDQRVAYLVTDILADNEARLPTFGQGNVLEIGRPAAAKTGTTTDWRDNWTVGYTSDLVAGVWAGNADNTPMMDISGVTGAGPIWHDFMVTVLRGTPVREFAQPEGLVRLEICADSGLLPGGSAPTRAQDATGAGGAASVVPCPARRLEWFITGTEPQEVDRMHREIAIDVRTGAAATEGTPSDLIHTETFWLLPAEYQDWARANSVPQPWTSELVTTGGGSGSTSTQTRASLAAQGPSSLLLISPENNRTYRMDRSLPPSAQQLPVVARPGAALVQARSPITLLVDGSPLTTVDAPDFTAWWPLEPGEHTLQAVAAGQGGDQVKSSLVRITVEP